MGNEPFTVEVSIRGGARRQVVAAARGLLQGLVEEAGAGVSNGNGLAVDLTYRAAEVEEPE